MENKEKFLTNRIIEDMSEGVVVINFDGEIVLLNRAAERILGTTQEELKNKTIAEIISTTDENDEFFELVLDAIYTRTKVTKTIPYFCNDEMKYLRITTDFMTEKGEKIGVIAQVGDITEATLLFLSNKQLASQIANLMRSFVEVMVTAIEEKSPYNANHTKSMVGYAKRYLTWLSDKGTLTEHTNGETDPFLMSIWLHDIGKLLVPPEIMDKPTRLGTAEKDILHRIETALLMLRIKSLTEPDSMAACEEKTEKIIAARDLILEANTKGILDEETVLKLKEAAKTECLTADGGVTSLLNDEELEAITVVRGTLTASERNIIESHVSLTAKLLSKMEFTGIYEQVPRWAGGHHELLDGSGYPEHLKSDNIPWETRLLTIIDVYDALTAEDRPYKPPMPPEKAFAVLEDMAEHGKIDKDLLESFRESKAWYYKETLNNEGEQE